MSAISSGKVTLICLVVRMDPPPSVGLHPTRRAWCEGTASFVTSAATFPAESIGCRGMSSRRVAGQRVALRCGIQRFELLGCEPHGDDLHRLSGASRTAATAALQLGDVVAGFRLIGPPLDLLLAHHGGIV